MRKDAGDKEKKTSRSPVTDKEHGGLRRLLQIQNKLTTTKRRKGKYSLY